MLLLADISCDGVSMQISAVPKDGAANMELVRYLSDILGVGKSAVSIEKGNKSRRKIVTITETSLSKEQVHEALEKELQRHDS